MSRSPDAGAWKSPKFVKAFGEVMREERDARGWTREDMVGKMPSRIGVKTLFSYESGIREAGLSRVLEIATVLGVSPAVLIEGAVARLKAPELHLIRVDLASLVASEESVLSLLQRWALHLIEEGKKDVWISPRKLGDFAAIGACEPRELAEALLNLEPCE